jgi:hypothetical protein
VEFDIRQITTTGVTGVSGADTESTASCGSTVASVFLAVSSVVEVFSQQSHR